MQPTEFQNWADRFRRVMERRSEAEEAEFLALAEEASVFDPAAVIPVLLESFLGIDDYGTQERVVSVLSSFDSQDYQSALLRGLPSIVGRSPSWAEILIAQEVQFSPEQLTQSALHLDKDLRACLIGVLTSGDFLSEYEHADSILQRLRALE